jgi:hypothetical protein
VYAGSSVGLCHEPLTPAQIEPMLVTMLRGKRGTVLGQPMESCSVYGHLNGFPAMGLVFAHLVVIREGSPPPGAIPVRPGNKHAFYVGSDISVSLLAPTS